MGDLDVIRVHFKSDSKKWLEITANVSQFDIADTMTPKASCDVNWVKYSDSGDI